MRVKGWALALFFFGGGLMSLLALALPTHGAPDPVGGRLLFGVTASVGLGLSLLAWARPQVLLGKRFDELLMVLGNACSLTSTLGETLLFGTQYSVMVLLWPMVLTAGFLRRRLLGWQVAFSSVAVAVLAFTNDRVLMRGEVWPLEALLTAIPVAFTGLAVAFFRSAAVQEAQELARLGRTDPLTGLSNRRVLFDEFAGVVAATLPGQRVALVMLDLDHFKQVNDRYGHQTGDEVLRCFAQTLQTHAQGGDLLVRMGGEEFVWVMAEPDTDAVVRRVEALRAAYAARPESRAVTVSAGVVHCAADVTAAQLSALLGAADAALYRAKEEGRNRTRVDAA
ncbi:diguanylate cyclase (GGDEF)-like protein [Deinococcus metalli]|uniref:Diguanylate cyclase (GGDEF)-like protein n=1 Tax=Deinococcus metalli TaxID=1141878 RepID=A0A7W8NQX0_9DEIO|nr:GGDEF domain-containing protein [Deinococcus metalli]MBB5378306.1 diguanylate cyclase (GGDEF)-like protein [Deinococcus metalli]GHF59846.1 hypothetical protein GCM10017781_40250 [Deinococcus metalli]